MLVWRLSLSAHSAFDGEGGLLKSARHRSPFMDHVTLLIYSDGGSLGSSSIFWRSHAIWTSTVRVSGMDLYPHTSCSNSSRERTTPFRSTRYRSSLHSRSPSVVALPCFVMRA